MFNECESLSFVTIHYLFIQSGMDLRISKTSFFTKKTGTSLIFLSLNFFMKNGINLQKKALFNIFDRISHFRLINLFWKIN